MKCPICKGSGEIINPLDTKKKKIAALILIDSGFGIRETQRLLGYKSSQSVSRIVEERALENFKFTNN